MPSAECNPFTANPLPVISRATGAVHHRPHAPVAVARPAVRHRADLAQHRLVLNSAVKSFGPGPRHQVSRPSRHLKRLADRGHGKTRHRPDPLRNHGLFLQPPPPHAAQLRDRLLAAQDSLDCLPLELGREHTPSIRLPWKFTHGPSMGAQPNQGALHFPVTRPGSRCAYARSSHSNARSASGQSNGARSTFRPSRSGIIACLTPPCQGPMLPRHRAGWARPG